MSIEHGITARRNYARYRHRQMAYGRWQPYIDAEPVRTHVVTLQTAGLGWKRIARLAGLSTSTVWKLLYGDPHRGMAPSKRVRPETAEKLLSVSASLDVLGDAATVDATGTRRRLQALVAIGWSQNRLAARIGMAPGNFGRVIHHAEQVQASTARAVRDLYEELWSTVPSVEERRGEISADRARNYAAARGWAPPLAWDEDAIDDPAAVPHGVEPATGVRAKLPPTEELLWLVGECGETHEAIADRFGVKPSAVRQALDRYRRSAA